MTTPLLQFTEHLPTTSVAVEDALAQGFAQALRMPEAGLSGTPLFARCIEHWCAQAPRAISEDPRLAHFSEHFTYYRTVLARYGLAPEAPWTPAGVRLAPDQVEGFKAYLTEFLEHVAHVALPAQALAERKAAREAATSAAAHAPLNAVGVLTYLRERSAQQSSPRFRAHLPDVVLGLPSEANLAYVFKHFEESLDIPGDVCEFGCFRGFLSVKLAFLIAALGLKKTVYAFDTFEGFQIDDPADGPLKIGAFSDTFDAYTELKKWQALVDIVPVKGDATQTCRTLKGPLSFVWLDLDMDVLMEPVLQQIWPLLTPATVIGIDDIGRLETPTVAAWVDKWVNAGKLAPIARYDEVCIGFYRPCL